MARPPAPDSLLHDEEDLELMTGEAVGLDLRPAGFVLRGAGAAIDWLVYFGSYILILLLLVDLSTRVAIDEAAFAALSIAVLVVCIVVAPTVVELATHGKSLGRLAVGARIVRDDGGAISFRHAFIRSLTGVLEIFFTFGGLAVLVALLNGRSKRLGDLLAGTYAQYERVARETPPAYGVPAPLQAWATTADVARLPDRLGRRISQFLANVASLTPETRARLARELAVEASAFVSPVPTTDAELFLAAVVAIRRERESVALGLERSRLERLQPALADLPHGYPERG